jgi:hypothetical protein
LRSATRRLATACRSNASPSNISKTPPNLKKLLPKTEGNSLKTDQHVSQMGADLAIQLMLMTLFASSRIWAMIQTDSFLMSAALDLAASYPLPQLPRGVEKYERGAAQMVITG